MKYSVSFQERLRLSMMQLSNQSPVTLEEARQQAQWIKRASTAKAKKQKD
jgi:hypothetical protein